jgi:hypothetical protein
MFLMFPMNPASGLAQTPAVRWRRPGGAILPARRHQRTALRTDIERQFTHLESEALIRPQRGRRRFATASRASSGAFAGWPVPDRQQASRWQPESGTMRIPLQHPQCGQR